MKTYKKVEVEAVNAPSGSYAAGCPAETEGPWRRVLVQNANYQK